MADQSEKAKEAAEGKARRKKIEIMRERRELREMLGDDDLDFDDEVFGDDDSTETYVSADSDEAEEEIIEESDGEDDFLDDDFPEEDDAEPSA